MTQVSEILALLKEEYPRAKIALDYADPLELLVSTILSAQCTDERVNIVTKSLFKKYHRVEDYASADLEELEKEVKSTGFYRNKARNIKKAAQIIVERFDSKVPDTMEGLTSLPGVARKTANIVLSNAYGKVEGIAVDTHVRRLSQRLSFTKNKDPDRIEQDLMRLFPMEDWFAINYLLIGHGRAVCKARKPGCSSCILNNLCPSAFKV